MSECEGREGRGDQQDYDTSASDGIEGGLEGV